jgi:hypothetical protein
MTRALPRTNFHSSRLLRCLADLALVDAVPPGNAFAEKLGLWLNFTDAINLFAAHNASVTRTPERLVGVRAPKAASLGDEVATLRANLTQAITKSCSPSLGKSRPQAATPSPEAPMDLAAAFEPYRRSYLAQQRDMELSIQPLRTRVRERLALTSPKLQKLAALDAAFDAILKEREGKLLGTVPALLEKRFAQLFTAHQQTLVETGQADNPALWLQAGSWLGRFGNELQTMLLAELDLRLQPTLGLVEAFTRFNQEISKHP